MNINAQKAAIFHLNIEYTAKIRNGEIQTTENAEYPLCRNS